MAELRVAAPEVPTQDRIGTAKSMAAASSRLDVTRIVVVGELAVAAVAVAWRLASRPVAPKATVTMGPGGWVSLKGGSVRLVGRRRRTPPVPSPEHRPVWARLLRARQVT